MTPEDFLPIALRCDPQAWHYEARDKGDAYTTWHEFTRIPLGGDNREAVEAWHFQVDHFTRTEFSPMAAQIYAVLDAEPTVTRPTHRIMYERETGYIHHIFQVEGV